MSHTITIHDADDLVTPVATLTGAFDRSVHPLFNDVGAGQFKLLLSDPDLAEVTFGRYAVLTDSATGTRFAFRIELQKRSVIKHEGRHVRVAHIQGRMLGAELEGAVVYPEGGLGDGRADSRGFNWGNPAFDDSGWSAAAALARQGTTPNSTSQWAPQYQSTLLPAGYADPDAYWMGPGVGDWEDSPDGNWYLRWPFTLGSAGEYRLEFGADNDCILFIDGRPLGDGGFGYRQTHAKDLTLAAGDHVIAVRMYNLPKAGNNPSAFLGSLWSIDDGELDSVVARTNGAAGVVVLNTPTTSGANGTLLDIDAPGMTIGEDLDIILTEAQDRGALQGWSWEFDADEDTAGTSWPGPVEVTLTVGVDDYLSVLRKLTPAHIDWTVDHDARVLNVYVKGTFGSSGVAYVAGESIVDLEADGEG